MSILGTEKYSGMEKSNHEHASQFGWLFEFSLAPEEYRDACKCFESKSELERIAQKHVMRVIHFRRSVFGRLLSFLTQRIRGNPMKL